MNYSGHENKAHIIGRIVEPKSVSHETHGKTIYKTKIAVRRINYDVEDVIPVRFEDKENTIDLNAGDLVEIVGEFHSYNYRNGDKISISLFIFARDIKPIKDTENVEELNVLHLIGNICKKPTIRHTNSGKTICDAIVAINRKYSKSDYLPCISWGKNAYFVSNLPVGTRVEIKGHMQSRDYIKILNDEPVHKIAYEVSIFSVTVI